MKITVYSNKDALNNEDQNDLLEITTFKKVDIATGDNEIWFTVRTEDKQSEIVIELIESPHEDQR